MKPKDLKRREFFRYSAFGLTGAVLSGAALAHGPAEAGLTRPGKDDPLYQKVLETPLIDTHEHLMNESERIKAGKTIWDKANDWSFLLSHYLDSDLVVAGMSQADHDRFFSADLEPFEKWKLIEPYWPHVKHTGYGLNVRRTLKDVYGIDYLTGETIGRLEEAYHAAIQPGFYRHLLRDIGNIESCQVNLWPFLESEQPDLLMSDFHISGMIEGGWDPQYAREAGIEVKSLDDWRRVIGYWIKTYGKKAVAVKSTMAYARDLDCVRTPPEEVEKVFLKKYLVTAPANKIFTFGGDYIPMELVPGHAAIARQGIALALSELVDEAWLTLKEAMSLTDVVMHQNARDLYKL